MNDRTAIIQYIETDFRVVDLDNEIWRRAKAVTVSTYWNGLAAPDDRSVEARLLWSDSSLYVRFDAVQSEPHVISETPDVTAKTIGLWERDVCEIFVAPDAGDRNRYFEFEIAPTGEWLDLGINVLSDKRETDSDYSSGLEAAARIDDDKVVMALRIPWAAFGAVPLAGGEWAGNLFRCVGSGVARGYLAWQPTLTDRPNFHVPDRFGSFTFVI